MKFIAHSRVACPSGPAYQENLERLAHTETSDNGKPIRETRAASAPRREPRRARQRHHRHHFKEKMGIVGQIIPWNFPVLMAAWKMASALATDSCVVIKPASDTPLSLAMLMDLIGDPLPPGVFNLINGHGSEIGAPLASSPRIVKIAFTGEMTTEWQIMRYTSEPADEL
jgi:aldehyde dehydrogenase